MDLDGDGLTGAAEKALGTNPLLPDNPLTFSGTPQGVPMSGQINLPLGMSAQLDAATRLSLYADGELAGSSEIQQGADGSWTASWDSTDTPNGTYVLQIGYNYPYSSPIYGGVSIVKSAMGPLVLANLGNPITFDPICDRFSDVLYFHGTFNAAVARYTINIYSDDGLRTPLGMITSDTAGGSLDDSWDFTSSGIQVNGGLECDFAFPYNPEIPQPVIKFYSFANCPLPGNTFTLAWAWDYPGAPSDFANRGTTVRMYLVDMLGFDLNGAPFNLLPDGTGGNVLFTSSFQLTHSMDAKTRLLMALGDADSSHFYFWGHGENTTLAVSRLPNVTDLSSSDIARATQNPASQNDRIYRHPYRFVFLDACETYTPDMSRAFGIPFSKRGSTSTVDDYRARHLPTSAFIGWDKPIVSSDMTCSVCDYYRVAAHELVLGYWQAGFSVSDAMAAFDAYLPDKQCYGSPQAFYKDIKPVVDPGTGKMLYIYAPMKTWKLSGCQDLTRFNGWP